MNSPGGGRVDRVEFLQSSVAVKQCKSRALMKTRLLKTMKLGAAMSLAVLFGCSNQSAQQDPPHTVVMAAAPAPTAPAPAVLDPNAADPVIQQSVEQAPPPPDARISPAAAEIVKMAQAGVGQDVMLSFIDKSTAPFNLSSDGVVYLNDLGIPSAVLTAMIKRDTQLNPAGATAAASVAQPQPVSNVPVQTEAPPTQPDPVAVPAPPTQVAYFYDSLSPYGSWMYVSDYGWCWRPTVSVVYADWRPYCDSGRWYWSDSGWYWHSDYSWGWAPFHYGRWFHHGHAGWMWHPDTIWGPSWVSWRYQSGYCGWAPLPPAAHWAAGVGFTYHGSRVSVGFDFGLASFHYAWVSTSHFGHQNPRLYCEPAARTQSFYAHSTVVNNYVVNNNTVINHGIGRDRVTKVTGSKVRHVSIREQPETRGTSVRGAHLEREGSSLVAYRPSLPKTPPSVSTTVTRPGKVEPSRAVPTASGAARVEGSRGTRDVPPARTAPENRTVTAPPSTQSGSRGSRPPVATQPAPNTSVAPKANSPAATAPTPRVSSTPARPDLDSHKGATRNDPRVNAAPTPTPSPRVSNVPTVPAPNSQPKYTPTPSTPAPSRSAPAVQTAPKSFLSPSVPAPGYSRPETRSSPPAGSYSRPEPSAHPPATFHQQASPAPSSAPAPSYSAPAPTRSGSSPPPSSSPPSSRGDGRGNRSDRSK